MDGVNNPTAFASRHKLSFIVNLLQRYLQWLLSSRHLLTWQVSKARIQKYSTLYTIFVSSGSSLSTFPLTGSYLPEQLDLLHHHRDFADLLENREMDDNQVSR